MNNKLLILLSPVVVGLFVAIAIPNFVGGGPSKLSSILAMLRQIDGAKHGWAEQHGFTNSILPLHEITQHDIAPLLARGYVDRFGFGVDTNGYICSSKDVLFEINPLGVSPTAIFLREYKRAPVPLPAGAVIKFDQEGMEEYILPGRPPIIYRWINQQFVQASSE
jgi:hypothetical protein